MMPMMAETAANRSFRLLRVGLSAALLVSAAACSDDTADEDAEITAQAGKSGNGAAAGTSNGTSGSGPAGGSSPGGSSSGGSSPGGSSSGGSAPVVSDFPDAQIYVDAHNAVRAAVQKPQNYSGTWAAVPPVTWSNDVAASAQGWANQLRDTMSCGLMHASGTGYGENLAAGSNVDAKRAVDMWAGEIDNYTYSPQYAFEDDTGHYTQIVWRKTTQIGCASAKCSGSSVVVCRYSPPGNYIGQQPY